MHESPFTTVYGLEQISRFVFPRRLRNVLSLDKAKLDTQIVYDTCFVCKVRHEFLALLDGVISCLTVLCRTSYWRAEGYDPCMGWHLSFHSSADCCVICFSVM